jgi:hypothetical protein
LLLTCRCLFSLSVLSSSCIIIRLIVVFNIDPPWIRNTHESPSPNHHNIRPSLPPLSFPHHLLEVQEDLDELDELTELETKMFYFYLIIHSSPFVVSSVCEIKLCKEGRESPCAADQEEHTPPFLAVEIRWLLRK